MISVALALSFNVNGQISKTEKRIIATIDNKSAAALDLLKKTVNINSGTLNFEGVRKVGNIYSEEYKKLGFEIKWIPGDSFGRAGHFVATKLSSKGPKNTINRAS